MANLALNSSPFPSPPAHEIQQEWGYGQLFRILLRRRWWVIGVFMGTITGMGILTLRSQPIYQSATQLLIEASYTAINSDEGFIDPTLQIDAATQVNVLKSSEILQRAVDKLSADYPTLDIEDLSTNLKVERVYGQNETGEKKSQTKLLLATYDGTDAIKTQKVLDAVLDVYKSYNLEQQQARITKGLAIINRKLPEVRASVIEAEKALEVFRKKSNVIDPQTESQSMTEALSTLTSQRQTLQAEISQDIANLTIARRQLPGPSSGILANAQINNSETLNDLKSQVQRFEIEIENLRQELTPQHPQLRSKEKELENAKQLYETEIAKINAGRGLGPSSVIGQTSPTDVQTVETIQQLEQSIASKKARALSLAETQKQLEAEIQRFPALIAQFSRLQPEVDARRSTLEKLLDEKEKLSLEIAKGGFDWEIIEQPQPGILISPDIQRNLLVGIVSGIFLGGLAAFAREALDDKVRMTAELDEQLALPLLGSVPQIDSLGGRDFPLALPFQNQSPQVELDAPEIFQWRPLREAMDLIYTNIQLLNKHTVYRSIMVTSSLSGEGKSTISIGLAISASRVDQRVLLIDGDMRRPRLHNIFNLNNEHGLSTLLAGGLSETEMNNIPQWVYMRWGSDSSQAELDAGGQLRTPLSDLNIDVITCGPIQSDPAKLLTVEKMQEIIAFYKTQYDLILIDSPPALGLMDAIPVGYGCDGVVMVARMDQVKRSEMSQALDSLSRLNLIGIIANGVSKEALQSSYYSS